MIPVSQFPATLSRLQDFEPEYHWHIVHIVGFLLKTLHCSHLRCRGFNGMSKNRVITRKSRLKASYAGKKVMSGLQISAPQKRFRPCFVLFRTLALSHINSMAGHWLDAQWADCWLLRTEGNFGDMNGQICIHEPLTWQTTPDSQGHSRITKSLWIKMIHTSSKDWIKDWMIQQD